MKLLWLDLETTGLDEKHDVILELGAIVTNEKLEELAEFNRVLHYPYGGEIACYNDYVIEMHRESGLWRECRNSQITDVDVELDLHQFLNEHFTPPMPIIAGNSISFDRRFLKHHMPSIEARLHYRQLDVSSWKIMFEGRYNIVHEKKKAHRALADIRESIAELKVYLEYVDFAVQEKK